MTAQELSWKLDEYARAFESLRELNTGQLIDQQTHRLAMAKLKIGFLNDVAVPLRAGEESTKEATSPPEPLSAEPTVVKSADSNTKAVGKSTSTGGVHASGGKRVVRAE